MPKFCVWKVTGVGTATRAACDGVRSLGVGTGLTGAWGFGFGAGWLACAVEGVGIIEGPKGVVLHCLQQNTCVVVTTELAGVGRHEALHLTWF